MAGTSKNGSAVNIGDHVSIIGKVVSVSGSGSLATVVVQSPLDSGTYSIQAQDCNSVEQPADASHVARAFGNAYGAVGDDITVLGVVTAISGTGVFAVMTVKLISSQTSITTATGNCTADNV